MKLKISLGRDELKSFFLSHIEKMLLAFIVLICAGLIAAGYQKPKTETTPEILNQLAAAANQHIDRTLWADVQQERVQVIDFQEKARNVTKPIKLSSYSIGPIRDLTYQPQVQRPDPNLYTVEQLEIVAITGPLAIRLTKAEMRELGDQFGDIRRSDSRRFGGRGGQDEDNRKLRQLSGEERKKFQGRSPRKMDGGFSGLGAGQRSAKAVKHSFVSLRGLVPIKKQFEEYDRCFKGSSEYLLRRDFPNYVYHYVERREIGAQGKAGEWEKIPTKAWFSIARKWGINVPEIADQRYLYGGPARISGMGSREGGMRSQGGSSRWPGLTWPLPPLLLRDVRQIALHSQVPEMVMDYRNRFRDGEEEEEEELEDAFSDEDDAPGEGRGGFGGGGLGGGFMDDEFMGGAMGMMGGPGFEGMGMGFGMGGGRGMGEMPEVDFSLFRVFDFDVVPGKSYQYRVQLVLEDANNPKQINQKPSSRALAKDVIDRILKLGPPFDEKGQRKNYFRKTVWSDPSAVVHVPHAGEVFLGPPSVAKIGNVDGLKYRRSPPEAEVVAVVWDDAKSVMVPGKRVVTLGTVINFTDQKVDAIDPIEMSVRRQKEFQYATNLAVADIRGGKKLPTRKLELLEPTEVLLVDANGNLSVHNEFDDYSLYSRYILEETDEESRAAGGEFLGGEAFFDEIPMGGGGRQQSRGGRGDTRPRNRDLRTRGR